MATQIGGHELTPAGMDEVLKKLLASFDNIENSQGSIVKLPKAELDFLRHLEVSRDVMMEVLQNQSGDRTLMLEIFGGDCVRIARVRAVCETVELSDMNSGDQRLKTCLNACDSVEKVMVDLGLRERLQKAQERERAVLEGEDDDTPDACLDHIARAASAESEAVALDREGQIKDALAKYEECQRELALAVGGLAADSDELPKIVAHHHQVLERIEYLKTHQDDTNIKPVEDHIKEAEIGLEGKRRKKKRYMRACAAVGAGGGLLLLGPFGIVAAVGAAAVGGVAGAKASQREDEIGRAARGAGKAAIGGADTAKTNLEKLSDAGSSMLQRVDSKAKVLNDKVNTKATELDAQLGVSGKLENATKLASKHLGAADEKLGVSDKLGNAQALASKHMGSAMASMKGGYPFRKKTDDKPDAKSGEKPDETTESW